jgi:type I restriction enzyme R subunit
VIDYSERDFEASIDDALLVGGPDGEAQRGGVRERPAFFGEVVPGGYHKRESRDYDRDLCLIARDALSFLYATQPKEWERFKEMHGEEARQRLLRRLASEVKRRGTLSVLRKGIKCDGCRFLLAYFRPSSGLNEELQRLYEANVFSVVRQLHYSDKAESSLDLTIFLNGLPVFTAELKDPLTGQSVVDGMRQYRVDRDPREPLLAFERCLAHFAVDAELVYVTSHLRGRDTDFLPFNLGWNGGAGNPPSSQDFATAYLWQQVWARESILDLVQQFIHVVEEEDDRGRKTGKRTLIFPRYHQLDCVRRLVQDARQRGSGRRYLIQHSAGSGKSFSIAWLAHRLSVLHDDQDRRVFDSIIVITDRIVLDRQLQRTVKQFEQVAGVVENIDQTSRQLKQALEAGKTIIVTTLQKFPVIAQEMGELPGHRFAVIVDEAHSSQTGEATKSVKSVLAAGSLEEAEDKDEERGLDLQDRIILEMKKRGQLPNVSYFAFTATPKPETMELFGSKSPDGTFAPFSLYSMRQAIEEKFIIDVLENYTTYKTYWSLLKKIEDDPHYERRKATRLLRSFVDLHEHAIDEKVRVMVDHFVDHVAPCIGGKAKAMIVTRSRLHAVRYKLAVHQYLKEMGDPFKALVAFSGQVTDPRDGERYTEAGMNGIPEKQTVKAFGRDENRLLVVAYKFQTGFDQPLLHTMYVDQKLNGIRAVQTLSRLNRVYEGKEETMVLDFVNDTEDIQQAFEPYYDRTILTEATDPNLLYDLETRIEDSGFYTQSDLNAFAASYFDPKANQFKLHSALRPVADRYGDATEDERATFREALRQYVRVYAFLSQILPFADADLEKLYVFGRMLLRLLPLSRERLPLEIQEQIEIDSYRLQETSRGGIPLHRGKGKLEPARLIEAVAPAPNEKALLSAIIRELNERFGTDLGEEDRVFLEQLESKLDQDPALSASVQVNTPENARLTFNHVAEDKLQDMIDTNFQFYKQITDDPEFAKQLFDLLFERYRRRAEKELLTAPQP